MTSSLRILIAEDLPSDVELVEYEIKEAGIEFISKVVATRDSFLEALEDFKPDIILSDYSMPLFDGMTALRLVQEHAPATPFIMVTGSMNEETAVECMKAGADDYLIKEHLRRIGPAIKTAIEKNLLERKKVLAEKALRLSEAKYRGLYNSMRDASVSVDMEGHILDCNESYLSMLGYSAEELKELTYQDITPEKWHAFQKTITEQQIIPRGYSDIYEKEYRRKDGAIFPVEIRTFLLLDDTENPTGMWAIVRDISERRQAQDMLRESEEKYRLLVENASEAIFVAQDEMFKFCNPKTLDLLRYSKEEILFNTFIYFIHPDDRDMVFEHHQRRIRGEDVPPVYSFRIIDKDGVTKWVEVNAILISWEGRPATLNFLSDITERKHAEMAWRNQMDFLETLIDTIPTPIYYKDKNGIYQGCNTQYASMVMGLAKEQIIGRTILDLTGIIPEELAGRYHDLDMDLIHTPGFRVYEEDQTCADGTARSFVISKASFFDTRASITGMVGIMMDISQRKRIEQELIESEHMLSIRNRISEIFLSDSGIEAFEETLNVILQINDSPYGLLGHINEQGVIITPSFSIMARKDCSLHDKTCAIPCFAKDQSIFNKAMKEKKSIFTNMPTKIPEGHIPIENVLAVPIIFQDEVIGIVAVANKASGYGEQDRNLLESIANQISPIINARLQKEQEEQKRMRAEESQRSQLLFLQQLMDAMPAPVFYKDVKGVYLGCNKAFEDFLGTSKELIVGKTSHDLAPSDHAGIYQDMDEKLFDASDVQVYETSVARADGSVRDVIFNKAVFVGTDGKTAGVVGVMLDITERKQTEELILKQNKVLDQSLDGIAIADLEGTIEYVNSAWASMHGYAAGELIGVNLDALHAPLLTGKEADSHLALLRNGISHTRDMMHKRKDGSIFPTLVSAFILKDIQSTPINIVVLTRDITEESRLETLLRQSQKMEAVGQLAGGIAHDFNNMLSPILGYSDLILQEMKPGEPHYQDILQIKQSGERARDLTWQLLAFSRKQVMEMRNVDIRDVVTDMHKILRRTIREDISIKVILSPVPTIIRADSGKVGQILMNLAVNAQDAMPQGGTITIETAEAFLDETYIDISAETIPGMYAMLSFSDTGSGIDHHTLEHIFEPFFTTKDPGKGTGLGLATVYGLVKQHGGHITVYSELGMGTSFKVYLPMTQDDGSRVCMEIGETREIRQGTETVIVVEDEVAVRDLVCRILRKQGYKVISAESAQECFQAIEHHQGEEIRLLLTDVIMPGMNGKELYEKLSTSMPGLKVLFLSGYTSDVVAEHGILMPGIHLISKPFSVMDLMDKVRSVLDE